MLFNVGDHVKLKEQYWRAAYHQNGIGIVVEGDDTFIAPTGTEIASERTEIYKVVWPDDEESHWWQAEWLERVDAPTPTGPIVTHLQLNEQRIEIARNEAFLHASRALEEMEKNQTAGAAVHLRHTTEALGQWDHLRSVRSLLKTLLDATK